MRQERIDRGDPVRALALRSRDEVERRTVAGSSVIRTLKRTNWFVRARVTDSVDEVVDDGPGFELELRPNNCATAPVDAD